MSMKMVLDIKNTEMEAELIVKLAIEDSKKIILEANNYIHKITEQYAEDTDNKVKEIIKKAEKEALAEVEKRKKEISDEYETIIENARRKFDQAVDLIIERIVKLNVSSKDA